MRRITARLMPLFCLMYLIAYIDRQNVSYAKLEMVDALGMSEAAYGLGASLFFLGYFLFEAPANMILARVGARAVSGSCRRKRAMRTMVVVETPVASWMSR